MLPRRINYKIHITGKNIGNEFRGQAHYFRNLIYLL